MSCYNPEDSYLPASFNAIPFEALSLTTTSGRRVAEGEYLFSNQNRIIDLGRRIHRFTIEGRFVGQGHTLLADALIKMIDLVSVGMLVHPTRGVLRVAVSELRFEENAHDDMGLSSFTMECVEARTGGLLDALTDWGNIGLKAVSGVISGEFKDMLGNVNLGGAALGAAATGAGALLSAYSLATTGDAQNTLVPETSANMRAAITNGYHAIPEYYANITENGLDYIARDCQTASGAKQAYKSVWSGSQAKAKNSPDSLAAKTVRAFTRRMALLYWIDAAADSPAQNNITALSDYTFFIEEIGKEIAAAQQECSPCLYNALSELQSRGRTALLSRMASASQISDYNLGETLPALVAAWEIYGSAVNAFSLSAMNSGLPWAVSDRLKGVAEGGANG